MTSEWEQRLADLWASFDDHGEDEFLGRMEALVAQLPAQSAVGMYERASAFDSTGHPTSPCRCIDRRWTGASARTGVAKR